VVEQRPARAQGLGPDANERADAAGLAVGAQGVFKDDVRVGVGFSQRAEKGKRLARARDDFVGDVGLADEGLGGVGDQRYDLWARRAGMSARSVCTSSGNVK